LGVVPAFYPQFSDDWKYTGVNMDDIGVSLPSATANAAHSQQVLTAAVVVVRVNSAWPSLRG